MILDVDTVAAGFIGFVYGFLGLPLIFYLINPIVDQVFKMWQAPLVASRYFASFIAFCFLIIVGLGSASVWLDFFSHHDELARVRLGKTWVVWFFFGMVAFALVPRIELTLRKYFKGDKGPG